MGILVGKNHRLFYTVFCGQAVNWVFVRGNCNSNRLVKLLILGDNGFKGLYMPVWIGKIVLYIDIDE